MKRTSDEAHKDSKQCSVFPYSILYRELTEILTSSTEIIFSLMQDRSKKHSAASKDDAMGPWIKDGLLHSKLVELKGCAEVVSKSCTKLTLIVTKAPSANSLTSILREMSDYVRSFVGSYMSLTECSLGNPFFVLVSTKVRSELMQVIDLVSVLSKGALTNATSATGMVWKTCENVQALPLSNKAAYRRHIMEKMSIIKDTIREFEEYLQSAKSKMDNMMENLTVQDENCNGRMAIDERTSDDDEEEGEEGEEFDGDGDEGYECADFEQIEESILLMQMSHEALKTGLEVMTVTADRISRVQEPPNILSSEVESSTVDSDAESKPVMNSLKSGLLISDDVLKGYSCDQWVADISHQSGAIEGAVTDFGALLYPPLDASVVTDIEVSGKALRDAISTYLTLLRKIDNTSSEPLVVMETFFAKFQLFRRNSKCFSDSSVK